MKGLIERLIGCFIEINRVHPDDDDEHKEPIKKEKRKLPPSNALLRYFKNAKRIKLAMRRDYEAAKKECQQVQSLAENILSRPYI